MPFGVDVINTLDVLPDDIVGYTELKNSSCTVAGTNANSSKYTKLIDIPLTADADVDDANILDPFSNSMLPLFHSTIPCCKNHGRFS